MLPGIVTLNNAPPTRAERRRAALLYAGDGAVLTGLDALELHGMERMPRPSGPVHLLVPTDRRRSGSGRVLAERTDRLPVAVPGRWPLTPIHRATLDFVRRATDRSQVRAAIAEVVQRGRCTPAENVLVMHTRPSELKHRGREVLDELRRNYLNAARRPRPSLVAVPAAV
jgi:hypothetical protein